MSGAPARCGERSEAYFATSAAVYFRAALGIASLSAVTNLIESATLHDRTSPPTEILPHVRASSF